MEKDRSVLEVDHSYSKQSSAWSKSRSDMVKDSNFSCR